MNSLNIEELPSINQLEAELCRRSLKKFMLKAWNVVEPATPFIDGWHIDAIIEHLEAVTRGEIKRLLITIPPRYCKSLLVSVMWPAWTWTHTPSHRFLCTSYSGDLSKRDNIKCRNIINSPWYQSNWGPIFKFSEDQNVKTRFENDKTGFRLATSVGGMTTGEGGNTIIVDDAHNTKEAESDVKIEEVTVWWDQTMSTRLNDQTNDSIVIVMQRIRDTDLAGHILAKNLGYDHLCLPCEYDGYNRVKSSIGFVDPRKKEGELLWPEKFPIEAVNSIKKQLGTYGSAGQLQQRPTPKGGGLIKLDWFKRYKVLPARNHWIKIVQAWDTASKSELTNAPWVGFTWALTKDSYFLIDVFRRRMKYPDGKRAIINQAGKWKPHVILIEDKSTGQSLLQELPSETTYPLLPFEPEKDKETRLEVESPAIEAGKVWIPANGDLEICVDDKVIDTSWVGDFEDEMINFPNSKTKDQADALSMSLNYFRLGGGVSEPKIWFC